MCSNQSFQNLSVAAQTHGQVTCADAVLTLYTRAFDIKKSGRTAIKDKGRSYLFELKYTNSTRVCIHYTVARVFDVHVCSLRSSVAALET